MNDEGRNERKIVALPGGRRDAREDYRYRGLPIEGGDADREYLEGAIADIRGELEKLEGLLDDESQLSYVEWKLDHLDWEAEPPESTEKS